MPTVAVLVGSLRQGSLNRKFAESLGKLAADRLTFRFLEIGDLPLYNQDLWQNPPEAVLRLKRDVEAADAVLFVTPETIGPTPPRSATPFTGPRGPGARIMEAKPSAVIGATPGATGTAAGQNALKGLLTVIDTVVMGQPEVYFTYKPDLFDESNNVSDEATKKFLNGWIDRFASWIARTAQPRTTAQADAA